MITRSEFQSSEGLMSQLAEILELPVMKLALEVVREEGIAVALPGAVPGVDYAALTAAAGAKSIGWAGAIRALRSLVRKPAILETVATRGPAYMQSAIKNVLASGQYTEAELNETLKP